MAANMLAVTRANRVWAMDISYIPMAHARVEVLEEAPDRHGLSKIFDTDQGS
jgi:hypothetical protein